MLLAVPSETVVPRTPCTLATMPIRRSDVVAASPSMRMEACRSSNLMLLTMTLPNPEMEPKEEMPVPPVPAKPAIHAESYVPLKAIAAFTTLLSHGCRL